MCLLLYLGWHNAPHLCPATLHGHFVVLQPLLHVLSVQTGVELGGTQHVFKYSLNDRSRCVGSSEVAISARSCSFLTSIKDFRGNFSSKRPPFAFSMYSLPSANTFSTTAGNVLQPLGALNLPKISSVLTMTSEPGTSFACRTALSCLLCIALRSALYLLSARLSMRCLFASRDASLDSIA